MRKADSKRMGDEIRRNKELIIGYNQSIDTETKKLQEDKQAEREERARRIDAAKRDVEGCERERNEVNDKIRQEKERITPFRRAIDEAEANMKKHRDYMEHCRNQIVRVEEQAKNRLNVFGRNMDAVLNQVGGRLRKVASCPSFLQV